MEVSIALTAFSALAQETRLEVLRALIRAGPKGMAAGALAESLGASAPTLSFHLKELVRAGLILSRRQGRSIVYAADYGGIRTLVDFLMDDCCQGDKRLCGPYVVQAKDTAA
ncbi:MAG: ArsR/SmtB family transcription factor [Parvularculaceae bacterium]